MKHNLTIGMVGSGGDGVVVLGSWLQRLAALRGYFSQMPRYYGAQIRGGGSGLKLSLNANEGLLPEDFLDLLVCFDWSKYKEFEQELPVSEGTVILCDGDPPADIKLPGQCFNLDFTKKSVAATGSGQNKNIVALGLLTTLLSLPQGELTKIIAREAELAIVNRGMAAYEAGTRLLAERPFPHLSLAPSTNGQDLVIMHGNTAIARGAIYAGCKGFFGYPITPASEIMEEMRVALGAANGVFLQAEDEIAAAGMVLGSSIVGVKSITATSGPGIDLMTETLGLAASAEIPMVVVDVQRCGPATGIPSKSEQSDLSHAIYGGHGDAPRVVVAPIDIEGCYRLAIEAVNISEYYQVPVILLSDQLLGQTLVATKGDFLGKQYTILERKKASAAEGDGYLRYAMTPDFISPMANAGDPGLAYQTSGLTHNEKGRPAFGYEALQRGYDKRWKKLLPLAQRNDLVRVYGDEKCPRGIVTWGSCAQTVLGVVKSLNLEGKVKVVVPELVHPLPDRLRRLVSSLDRLMVVELNYSGQLYRYLRSEVDLPKRSSVFCRAGGRPFSGSELIRPIGDLAK